VLDDRNRFAQKTSLPPAIFQAFAQTINAARHVPEFAHVIVDVVLVLIDEGGIGFFSL
jgi:hypothetical protein